MLNPDPELDALLDSLQARFEANMHRHQALAWSAVYARLAARPASLRALYAMERTGGEPDVVVYDPQTGEISFIDCVAESPLGRRNLVYDRPAQVEREKKGVFPAGNVIDTAAAIGIELLDEAQYRMLQQLGPFDTKTSSWLRTPADIRQVGGAIFGDFRYGHVFIYHNSAPSFYGARGFRGALRV